MIARWPTRVGQARRPGNRGATIGPVTGLRLLFVLGGIAPGALYPFIAVILESRGFEPIAIGLVTGLSSLVFALSVPGWSHLADVRFGRIGALRIVAVGAGLTMVTFGLAWPPIVLAGMAITYAVFQAPIGPLSDALAINALADPERSYGRIRLLTSLAFAVTAILAGLLYDQTGYWPATVVYALACFGIAGVLVWVRDVPRADLAEYRPAADHGRGGSMRVALAMQPRLRLVLVAIFLAHVGVIAGFTFLALRIVELGGQPSDVALSAAVAGFAEIPGMVVAGRIAGRVGLRGLYGLSCLVYGAAMASWVVLGDPTAIVATRVFTGFAFAGMWVGAVLSMRVLLPERLQATGQGLYQAVAFGLAAMVANTVGGVVFAGFGAGVVFGLAALLLLAAAVVTLLSFPTRGELPAFPAERVPIVPEPALVIGDAGGR